METGRGLWIVCALAVSYKNHVRLVIDVLTPLAVTTSWPYQQPLFLLSYRILKAQLVLSGPIERPPDDDRVDKPSFLDGSNLAFGCSLLKA